MDHALQLLTSGSVALLTLPTPDDAPVQHEDPALAAAIAHQGQVGMAVFRLAYRAVGLGWLVAPTGWPLLRPLFPDDPGGAVVLLVTDGLERDRSGDLAREADRLHRSCRRLVWLNPLLRFDGFEARAQGIRALLPHVDEFRTVHTIAAVADLAAALDARRADRSHDPRLWLKAA